MDITKELFLAKLHGLLAKTEVQVRIKKENIRDAIKRSLGKTEEQAESFAQEIEN